MEEVPVTVEQAEINLLIKDMKTDIIPYTLIQTVNQRHHKCVHADGHNFVRKYHNLYIKTPCLMRPFSEFHSVVAIDRFDCITKYLT
jgi:hypothetical protein